MQLLTDIRKGLRYQIKNYLKFDLLPNSLKLWYLLLILLKYLRRISLYELHKNKECDSFSISVELQNKQFLKCSEVLGIVCLPLSIRNW